MWSLKFHFFRSVTLAQAAVAGETCLYLTFVTYITYIGEIVCDKNVNLSLKCDVIKTIFLLSICDIDPDSRLFWTKKIQKWTFVGFVLVFVTKMVRDSHLKILGSISVWDKTNDKIGFYVCHICNCNCNYNMSAIC